VKYIIVIFGIYAQCILAENNAYQQFQEYMSINGGRILTISINQNQNGNRFHSNGTLYYFGDHYYTYDDQNQRITYDYAEITTINKITKQVIYDYNILNQPNILDILTGQKSMMEIGEIIFEKSGFRIPFEISSLDISGILWTIPDTGEPKKIKIKYLEDTEIQLSIISSELFRDKNIAKINTAEYEIINLRE